MPKTIAEIILDQTLDRTLDYEVPTLGVDPKVGMRVEVPLRGKMALGTICALKEKSAFKTLKPLSRLLSNEPVISEELFQLARFISTYYLSPLSRVIKTMLPPSVRGAKTEHKTQAFIKSLLPKSKLKELCQEIRAKHPSQAKVLDLLLLEPKGLFQSEILEKADVSQSPINTLLKKKIISSEVVRVDRSPIFSHDFFPTKPKKLTEEQSKTLEGIEKTLGTFRPHLIYGITGSGKTEIYLQAIQKVLEKNQSVLYLVPEISLTSQTIERFKGRFGNTPMVILHHKLSDGERFDAWHLINEGKVPIVIGARSALFSPVKNLGLIVVDEEHESSYKQSEESPKYSARDVAIVRAKMAKCPILLGTATPSLESYQNAISGKYDLHVLKNRPQLAKLASVKIIDMKPEYEKACGFTLFSQPLLNGIKDRFSKGEQTLLFLNRRGYHTSATCPKCAHIIACPNCDLSLTFHRGDKILACHLCDHKIVPPRQCPECQADGPLKFKGAGTELVERSLHALFPDMRTLRLDADTTRHKGSHEKIFKAFRSGKADVLIGTQMIAKGLHFPTVTLVGVLTADGSLNIPDFRASENVFQLLTQVAGRSGRGALPGEVLIQTLLPDHTTIKHAACQDFEAFYAEEIEVRELFHFPPFNQLIKFSFSGSKLEEVEKAAFLFQKKLTQALPKNVEILPVIPCGYTKIAGKFRFQCLIKVEKVQRVLGQIEKLRKSFERKGDLRLSIDVDPLSTFF